MAGPSTPDPAWIGEGRVSIGPSLLKSIPNAASSSTPPVPVRAQVVLWAPELQLQVALQNRGLPQVTRERAGGFRSIPVPQARPITTWDGYPSVELTIVGMFDAFPTGNVVDEVRLLRRLGSKVSPVIQRPPLIRPIGRVPVPTTGLAEYVLTGLSIVEEEHVAGQVARALCTLTLEQWVQGDIEQRRERVPATEHTWTKADTLHKLAKDRLGDARRTGDIRKANPKIKTWSTVKPGTTIKIPPR